MTGNTDPVGFGHVGFLVDDLGAACDSLIKDGVEFKKKPDEGKMRSIAFAYDPDGKHTCTHVRIVHAQRRQTGRQAGRQAGRQTDRQTEKDR